MGTFHRKLERPALVGEISAAEASEVKTVNALLGALKADAEKARQVVAVTEQYRLQFLRGLLETRGLPPADLYSISDDTGQITKTHELVKPEILQGGSEERAT